MLNCDYFLSNYISFPVFLVLNGIVFILVVLFTLLRDSRSIANYFGLLFVGVGGINNLFQRAVNGCVRDQFHLFNALYFNFSDIILLIGVVILTVGAFYEQKHTNS